MPKNLIHSFIIIILISSCFSEKHEEIDSKIVETYPSKLMDSTQKQSETKMNFLHLDSMFVKDNFRYKGKLKDYLIWKDKEGMHVVFTSETGIYHTDINEEQGVYKQNAEIFCFHYVKKVNDFSKVWSIYDYSKDCPVDAMAKFCDNSLEVTDLDQNGIPEIWTAYRIACRGDVSPSALKLIMYEVDKKYKLQGHSRIEVNENEKYGGDVNIIINFKDQKVFNDYAKRKWDVNIKDTFS